MLSASDREEAEDQEWDRDDAKDRKRRVRKRA